MPIYKKTVKQNFILFSYPSILTYVLGAKKNHLSEMVLLSTHNIHFGQEKENNLKASFTMAI